MTAPSRDTGSPVPSTSDSLLMVGSKQAEEAAARIRGESGRAMVLRNGVEVTAAQLDAVAQILRAAEPSVITRASGPVRVKLNDPQERPGFIDRDQQDDPKVLRFTVGILPSTDYRIDRDGTATEAGRG